MELHDRIQLIRGGVAWGGVWADLGCGEGAFTEALAEAAGPDEVEIHALDRDARALNTLTGVLREQWPRLRLETHFADLRSLPPLPPLDGVLMANVLHFLERPEPVLEQVRARLKPGGRLVVVEYDTDWGNPWVPHPRSFRSWENLAVAAGFSKPRLLGHVRSRWLERCYGAVSQRAK